MRTIAITAVAVLFAVSILMFTPASFHEPPSLGPPAAAWTYSTIDFENATMTASIPTNTFESGTAWNPFKKKKALKPAPKPKAPGNLVGPADARFVLLE